MIDARLETLSRRHTALEDAIHQEEAHPYHDELKIKALKHEKLKLKEEMRRLEDQAANNNRQKWH